MNEPVDDGRELSIELDCAPGGLRPNDLLPCVIEGLGITLDPENTVMRLFGNWKWMIPQEQRIEYLKVRDEVARRIKTMYESGMIRYGSW